MSVRYLVPCAYCIALLDFISALLFAIISGLVFSKHGNWTAVVALVFTVFWMIIIIILAAGIYRRKLKLVRFWLIFTCLGIILDGIILLYGLTLAIASNWDGVKITVLPFVGLAVEMTFVYIIYLFYPHLEKNCSDPATPPPYPPEKEHHSRSKAGYIVEVKDEVKNEVTDEVQDEVEDDKKPLQRKELKRMEKKAKERMKRDKAAIKELKKQMRKKC